MKNPLHYQISEYDCGPTSLLNGISYLFERDQISPEIIRNIMLYCLDCYGSDGCSGKSGTSCMAMMFLSNWINGFGRIGQMNIKSQYLSGREVTLGQESYIEDALLRKGVVVVRLYEGGWHYVLFTGKDMDNIYLFDPYYDDKDYEMEGISVVLDQPYTYNRVVRKDYFLKEELGTYAFGEISKREAVILYNEDIKIPEASGIEYFI